MPVVADNCQLVYFRVISSGDGSENKEGNMVCFAATCKENMFTSWIKPTEPIAATNPLRRERVEFKNFEWFVDNEKVVTKPLTTVLADFLEFLKSLQKPALLVAHAAKFDFMHLLQAIGMTGMVNEFKDYIAGFADSFPIFARKFPNRTMQGQLSLRALLGDLLKLNYAGKFHQALYSCQVLETLVTKFIPTPDLIGVSKTYEEAPIRDITIRKVRQILQTLKLLENVLPENMLKKMALAGISYGTLKEICKLITEHEEFNSEIDMLIKEYTNRRQDEALPGSSASLE